MSQKNRNRHFLFHFFEILKMDIFAGQFTPIIRTYPERYHILWQSRRPYKYFVHLRFFKRLFLSQRFFKNVSEIFIFLKIRKSLNNVCSKSILKQRVQKKCHTPCQSRWTYKTFVHLRFLSKRFLRAFFLQNIFINFHFSKNMKISQHYLLKISP